MRARHRLSKLLLRHGIRFDDGAAWTERHRQWLGTVKLDTEPALLPGRVLAGDESDVAHQLLSFGEPLEVADLSAQPDRGQAGGAGDDARRARRDRRAQRVDPAQAPQPADLDLPRRAGDHRQDLALQRIAAVAAITKTGSGHARRLLVEAAWHYRKHPAIGKALTDRQASQPPEAIAVAWSAQQRLHRTWNRLEQRAKRRTIIAAAAARELAGFCWAITQIE
jgi:transposase